MEKKRIKGLHAANIFLPTILITGIINLLIIISTVLTNIRSTDLTEVTNESTFCSNNLSSITVHSSKLADTIVTYVYTPVIPTGPSSYIINDEPISQYVDELTNEDRNPDVILENLTRYKKRLSGIKIDDEQNAYELINDVIIKLKYLLQEQARALTILSTKYEVPSYVLEAIDSYTLTSDEQAFVDSHDADEVKDYIFESVLFKKEYSLQKRDLNLDTNELIFAINKAYKNEQASLSHHLKVLRICLWILLTLTLIITILFFVILYRLLIKPIIGFSKKINNNERLNDETIMYETNLLASSYNELLDRHHNFEAELRVVAEIDSLTGLPNRHSYNEYLKQPHDNEDSVCVFLFDINNLKYVNDTFGHSKGDELIKNASQCLKECFLNTSGNNCYRIGGDEFVAILESINENDIKEYVQKFLNYQRDHDISIAYGYSYTKNISKNDIEKLVITADKRMYRNKKETYKQNNKNDLILKTE